MGASVGLARMVEETSRALSEARDASSLRALVPDADGCSVCARLREDEGVFIKRLARFLQEPASRQAYAG